MSKPFSLKPKSLQTELRPFFVILTAVFASVVTVAQPAVYLLVNQVITVPDAYIGAAWVVFAMVFGAVVAGQTVPKRKTQF